MRKRLLLVIASLAMLAFIAVFWKMLPPKEPVYAGKPLSYWLMAYDMAVPKDPFAPSEPDAEAAIRAIGTNAIPTLLQFLQKADSRMVLRFYRFTQRQQLFKLKWKYRYAFVVILFPLFSHVPSKLRLHPDSDTISA